ncbi:unnamed protein product [Withania somnifera]
MSSPVPRRESPWGMPDGDNRQPKPHRCNDRVEDVVQACFEGNPFKTIPGPFKLFWQCMRSKPGEEPTEPFYYLQLEPPREKCALSRPLLLLIPTPVIRLSMNSVTIGCVT